MSGKGTGNFTKSADVSEFVQGWKFVPSDDGKAKENELNRNKAPIKPLTESENEADEAAQQVQEEKPLTCYQRPIRWWYRKSYLQSALLYPVLKNPRLLEGPNRPLENTELTRGEKVVNFVEGWNFITRKLYPMAIGVLLTHDIWVHLSKTTLRYGVSIGEILLGARYSPASEFAQSRGLNQQTITSAWGSDLPFGGDNDNGIVFWVMPLTILTAAFLSGTLRAICKPSLSEEQKKDLARQLEEDIFYSEVPNNLPLALNASGELPKAAPSPWYKKFCNDLLLYFSPIYRNVAKAEFVILWDKAPTSVQRNELLEAIGKAAQHRYLGVSRRAISALAKIADDYPSKGLDAGEQLLEANKYESIQLKNKALELLKETAGLYVNGKRSFYRLTPAALYARYQLWTLQRLTGNSCSDKFLNTILIPSFVLMSLYMTYRYYLMPIQKIVGSSLEVTAKKDCEAKGLKYIYDRRSAQNDCVVRAWPFASYRQMRSAQGCIDALLAVDRTPAIVLEKFKDLIPNDNFNPEIVITDVDLSKNMQGWRDDQWRELFQKLKGAVKSLDSLNLTFPADTKMSALSANQVQTLKEFLLAVPVKKLILDNLYLGTANIQTLMPALQNSQLEYLSMRSCNIDNDGMDSINRALKDMSGLKTLILGKNPHFNDSTGIVLGQTLNQTAIETLDVAGNTLNLGLNAILESTETGPLRNIVISDIPLTRDNAKALGKAMTRLQTVECDRCNLGSSHIEEMAPNLPYTTVLRFTARNNEIRDNGCMFFFKNLPGDLSITVDLSTNILTDAVMPLLGEQLKTKNVYGLILDGNTFTPKGFQKFMVCVPQTSLRELSVANTPSLNKDDETAKIIATILQANPGNLTSINLSRLQLSSTAGRWLLELPNYSSVSEINVSDNAMACEAIKQALPVKLKKLDISFNAVNDSCLPTLTQNITGSALSDLNLRGTKVTGNGIFNFVKHLIKETTGNLDPSHFEELGDEEVSIDFRRALHWDTVEPATSLTQVDLRGATNLNTPARNAIDLIGHIVPGIEIDPPQISAAGRRAEPIFIFRWLAMIDLRSIASGIKSNMITGTKRTTALLAAGGGFFASHQSLGGNSVALRTEVSSTETNNLEGFFNPSTLISLFFMLMIIGFYLRLVRSSSAENFLRDNTSLLASYTGIGLIKKPMASGTKEAEQDCQAKEPSQSVEEKSNTPTYSK